VSAHIFVPGKQEVYHRTGGHWIRDVVLGANDGLVSVLALIAGVAGAASGNTVLIAGIAGVVAGALSMSLGAFVSARSYRAYYRRELERERWEMVNMADIERDEIRKIYREKGFDGAELEMVVERITSNPDVWLDVMMNEELGLSPAFGQPLKTAGMMLVAFASGGVIPVFPWFFAEGTIALALSMVVTGIALMLAGWGRAFYTGENPVRSGAELVGIAGLGVAIAYVIGRLVGVAV
jgi:VIT1/CCC1 family predicted Fe2+/Mn2+ transporter